MALLNEGTFTAYSEKNMKEFAEIIKRQASKYECGYGWDEEHFEKIGNDDVYACHFFDVFGDLNSMLFDISEECRKKNLNVDFLITSRGDYENVYVFKNNVYESMPKNMYTLRTMPAHMLIDDLSRRNTEIYVYTEISEMLPVEEMKIIKQKVSFDKSELESYLKEMIELRFNTKWENLNKCKGVFNTLKADNVVYTCNTAHFAQRNQWKIETIKL